MVVLQGKRSLDAGASSLQMSLLESDNEEPVACKRKLNAPTHQVFTAPVLYVSGCRSDASSSLAGRYTSMRWHHGKPLYQKEEPDGPDGYDHMPVVLYFWDNRDGKRFHGWWFSPREGSSDVWAYNPSNLDPDDLRVPTSGWKRWKDPCDPDVHIKLHITRCQNMDEHRWEFEANGLTPDVEEEEKNWQPTSKALSDALEERWIKGWEGDNGRHDFDIDMNGSIYGIDAEYMLQWNKCHQKSGRVIRRVEADHKRLAEERDRLKEERNMLRESVVNLKRERDALNNHASQMMLQETWRMNRQLQTKIRTELNDVDGTFSILQKALTETCPTDHYGDCLRMRHFSITGIEQICNVRIWKDYEFRKEQVRKELDGRLNVPAVTDGLPSRMCKWAHLDERINEVLLIHGTTVEKIDQIANFGFDERLARERGLYGQGVYFTDQSCKSLQYSGANRDNTGCFIIARVILGHPCDAQGPLKQLKVEPLVDPNDASKGRCHSVLAKPGTLIPNPRSLVGGQRQLHREFVLFNGAQAYPEMIAHFIC